MKKRDFLLLLVTLLLGICSLHYSCKPKNCCCDLAAPASLTATVLDTTTVKLEWPPVTGAAKYRITVKDISSNTSLPQIIIVGTDTLLTGLTPDHEYTAIVQAICAEGKACPVSPNGAAVCFRLPKTVIVQDIVVMREYHDSLEIYCAPYTSQPLQFQGSVIPLNFNGATYVIYQFEVRLSSGATKYFKLAYDSTCTNPNIIRGFICSQTGCSLTKVANTNNILEFKQGFSTLVTLTATSTGINISSSCSSCTIKCREYSGTEPWVGGCQ